jgi:hypothetical protein
MKNVEKSNLQGRINIGHGLAKKLGILALGTAFLLSPLASPWAIAAGSGAVTHIEAIQWIAQAIGEQLPAGATATDHMDWARAKGMNPTGGWQPGAKLTRQALAQILVQLYGLKENKFGGDYVRILEREGISVPSEEEISRESIARVVDDPVVRVYSNRVGAGNGPKGPNGNRRDEPPPSRRDDPARRDDQSHKVTLCHKGHSITVSQNALQAHLAHGDTIGPCVVTEVQNR